MEWSGMEVGCNGIPCVFWHILYFNTLHSCIEGICTSLNTIHYGIERMHLFVLNQVTSSVTVFHFHFRTCISIKIFIPCLSRRNETLLAFSVSHLAEVNAIWNI